MSEEIKNNQPEALPVNDEPKEKPEKPSLDEGKKSALLRYVAILFAVAFVLVLISMLGQMRLMV